MRRRGVMRGLWIGLLGVVGATNTWASELQVSASRPVVVAIDGAPTGIAGTLIDTKNLDAGQHKVEVRSFMGATLASLVVEVGDYQRIRLTWDRDNKSLYELERVHLTSPAVGPPQPASSLPPVANAAPTGSLTVTGLSDISGVARVHGTEMLFDSDTQGFLASSLRPPAVELHLTDNGVLRYHGAVDVEPGQHRVCHLFFKSTAWTVECRTSGAELR